MDLLVSQKCAKGRRVVLSVRGASVMQMLEVLQADSIHLAVTIAA